MRLGGKSQELLSALAWCGFALYSPATARMMARHALKDIRPDQLRRWEANRWIIRRKHEQTSEWIVTLTDEGRRRLAGGRDIRERLFSQWDGKWRVMTFDVPRGEGTLRQRLIRWLKERDFVCLQGSVWISAWPVEGDIPRPREALASPLNVLLFETEQIQGLQNKDIIECAWDWDTIRARHQSYREHLGRRPTKSAAGEAWADWVKGEHDLWIELIQSEALLPEPLQPSNYPMKRAWQLREKALAAAAR